MILLQLEVDPKNDEAESHDGCALEEEDPTAGFIDEDWREVGGNGLYDADDDGGDDGRDVGAGGLEDVVGVEDDGVDAAELLEEHEAEAADERHAGRLVGHHAHHAGALPGCVVHLWMQTIVIVNCELFDEDWLK